MKFVPPTTTVGLTLALLSCLEVVESSSSSSPLPSSSSAFAPNAPIHASVALAPPGTFNTNTKTINSINTDDEDASTSSSTNKNSPDYKLLWSRVNDIATVVFDHAVPLLGNTDGNKDDYWQIPTRRFDENNVRIECTNADRFIGALQLLCPTYVQCSRAIASNGNLAPNVLPGSIRQTLARQYKKEVEGSSSSSSSTLEFDLSTAKSILQSELSGSTGRYTDDDDGKLTEVQVAILIDTLTPLPHLSINPTRGQMYMGYLPEVGTVTLKIQHPGWKQNFEKDAKLLQNMAQFVQTFCDILPDQNNAAIKMQQKVQDLTSTLERDMDYNKEIESGGGEILKQYSTEHVIVSRQMQVVQVQSGPMPDSDIYEDSAEDIAESVSPSITTATERAAESAAEIAAEHSVKSSRTLDTGSDLQLVTQGGGGFRKLVIKVFRMDMKRMWLTFLAILSRIVTLGQLELYVDEA